MTENSCVSEENIMILACSGGSNVGQLSNQAAIELTREGFGKVFCFAGIGGRLGGFVQSAKDVNKMIAIDGCQVGCAKAILVKNGIEKNKNFDLVIKDLDKVKTKIKEVLG